MDGLTVHILQELAFEGDLGSDVSRLRQIVSQYYTTRPLASNQSQIVDDEFCAFVWKVLATQNHVVVGVAPEGAAAVYFPPQPSKVKASGKGKNKAQPVSVSLSPLSPEEVMNQSLNTLVTKYGDGLRIAVEPDVCFVCLTGSHIRPAKLSANAYAVLQLITRTRAEGISVADISRQSGYDPKTCFYFVKILVDFGHVHKIKVGGAAVNICVHKSFYEQCAWKLPTKETTVDPESHVGDGDDEEEDSEADKASGEFTANIQFESIDNRHMANLAVVKGRIERLLRHTPNGLHVYRYLLEATGFKSNLKKERRVFTHRVHELLKSRFIEKVWAPSSASSTGRVLCIRLVNNGLIRDDVQNRSGEEVDDTIEPAPFIQVEDQNEVDPSYILSEFEAVHPTQSIAGQIIALIEQSDMTGMTFADIARCLHDFDARSITKLTTTFASGQPPTHLSHRALVIVTEMYGRERRQRLFTLAAYRRMIEQEGLEDQSVLSLEDSGAWALFDPGDFAQDEESKGEWLESSVRKALSRGGRTREKRAKQGFAVNPLDENGLPIKGRPKTKGAREKVPRRVGALKRKAHDIDGGEISHESATKKRHKPLKTEANNNSSVSGLTYASATTDASLAPKLRGRPKISKQVVHGPIDPLYQHPTGPAHEGMSDEPHVMVIIPRNQGNLPSNSMNDSAEARQSNHPTGNDSTNQESPPDRDPTPVPHPSKRPRLTENDSRLNITNESFEPAEVGHLESTTVAAGSLSPQPTSLQPLSRDLLPVGEGACGSLPPVQAVIGTPEAAWDRRPNEVVPSEAPSQPALRSGKTTNVSALRRQAEFIQLLENKGGVINVSFLKAFNEDHQKLLHTLHAAGKAVSTTPGTGMDKRTFNTTISSLEFRGLVKTLVVSALTIHGTTRKANIVYLTDISQESIDKCVEEFRSAGSLKNVPLSSSFPEVESVPHDRNAAGYTHSASPLSVPLPLPLDPLSAAREAQLTDLQTVAQVVGYKTGHFARARTLYLCLLSDVYSGSPPASLVSPSDRLFSRKYLFEDIPLSTYCAIIPQHVVIPGLKELLETEAGGATRIRDVPGNIQPSLRHHSSANRNRMHKLLSSLVALGCLVPASVQFNAGASVATYVDTFDAEGHWEYMRIAATVPVYRFADKELGAPLSYYHEVRNYSDGVKLWEQLRVASQISTYLDFQVSGSGTQLNGNPKLLKGILRKGAWADTYTLSALQIDYLYSLVDPASGTTPLDDPSSTRFDNACFVTTAPLHVVTEFFSRTRADIQRDLERVQASAEQKARKLRRITEDARHALAIKAAKAKKDQDARWHLMVSGVLDKRDISNPQLQKALLLLKTEFAVSSQRANNSIWEARIKQTYQDTLGAKQFVIVPTTPPQSIPVTRKPQEELDPSVSKLIIQQGAPVRQKKDVAPKKSGRKSKKEIDETTAGKDDQPLAESEARRRRFPWNADYDELARDAAAIIRVRCRSKRMDWSAVEQVFPGVQRNSVRQRVSNLQALPGASEYFQSLDDAWETLWMEHRGSEALPDPNPDSVTDFDLPAHVSFLRQNVNKAALHAGAKPAKLATETPPNILIDLEQTLAEHDVKESSSTSQPTSWDFFFDIPSEERREREFLQHPFVVGDLEAPSKEVPPNVSVAQGAVKMTISTPEALYNSDDAAATLALLGDHTIKLAMQNMGDTIVRKQAKLGRTYPMRQYTYSDSASYFIKGDFANAMYADASAMREHLVSLGDNEWRNIDLTDEDGETATFLQLLSEDTIEVNIDTTIPAVGRDQMGWQSKKVDDENLEAHIAMRLVLDQETAPSEISANPNNTTSQTYQNPPSLQTTPCSHGVQNDVICPSCLGAAKEEVSASDQLIGLAALREAGADGMPIRQVLSEVYDGNMSAASLALTSLAQTSPPLVYIVGYDQARVITSLALPNWTIRVVQTSTTGNETKSKMVLPRQWTSIHGNLLENVWISVTRAVAGSLMFRPCISEHALRKHYRGVFDRQELNDILKYLLATKKLTRITEFDHPVGMLDLEMERSTYWLLANGSTWF